MKKTTAAALALVTAFAAGSAEAGPGQRYDRNNNHRNHTGRNIAIGIGVGVAGGVILNEINRDIYYGQQPVYVPQPPVYVDPPQVYYQPQQVYRVRPLPFERVCSPLIERDANGAEYYSGSVTRTYNPNRSDSRPISEQFSNRPCPNPY